MFHITRKADYAVRGMVHLASQPADQITLLAEMAMKVDVPQALMAKIFQHLAKVGLVRSFRGARGGFQLAKPPKGITLLDIVEAIDGPIAMNRCIIEEGACGRESFCTVHPVWKKIQGKLRDELRRVNLQDLATR
ncbi:MAG: Rrf2 family transcriptional regulator [Smithellaceae bacterium]|nr:Rrf2 family transcriptional regulator [Smithellaceae bacterium]